MPLITSRKYDPSDRPPVQKSGVTIGMGMTEKQGGTDVRANTTQAEQAGDGVWQLTGHKWFFSAPMCDAFLVLAQMHEGGNKTGLGCFLVPRKLSDGRDNGLQLAALEGQAGQSLQRLQRGRVSRQLMGNWSANRAGALQPSSRWST